MSYIIRRDFQFQSYEDESTVYKINETTSFSFDNTRDNHIEGVDN